jgi:hypothetical protein
MTIPVSPGLNVTYSRDNSNSTQEESRCILMSVEAPNSIDTSSSELQDSTLISRSYEVNQNQENHLSR